MAIMAAVEPFIGVPYKLHGRDPGGWDCLGCMKFIRRHVFNRESPSWEDYRPADVADPAQIEEHLARGLSQWREVELAPGAAILLRMFGRSAHVGVYLEQRQFIHCLAGCETAVQDLSDPRWRGRFVAAYECC